MKRIEKRKSKQKHLLLIALLLVIILIGVIIIFKVRYGHPKDNLVYQKFDMIGGKIDDDKYYLFGAKRDISFEVKALDNFSYKVLDEDDKQVSVQHNEDGDTITILAPKGLYEEGKTYHLKIENGNFIDNKYGNVKEIIFNVLRPSKQSSILKDNLLSVDIKNIKTDSNTIKINGNYKENDIILGYDNDNLIAAYKIVKKRKNNSYEYSVPELSEIFKEIDYYGMERINLSDYANNKDFNLFLTSTIRDAILNSLVNTVYAKEDVTISKPVWNKKNHSLEVGITIDTIKKENFLANHNAKIELTMIISIDLYHDITINNYDYVLVLNYNTNINHGLKHIDNNFISFYNDIKDKETIKDYDTKWLEENYDKINSDKLNLDKKIGNISVNTNIPGLILTLDTGIVLNINSKTFSDATFNCENQLIIGINDTIGTYHNYQSSNSANGSFVGDTDNKIGGSINTRINFLNTFNFNVEMTLGMYTDGKSTVTVDKKNDKDKEVIFDISGKVGNYQTCLVNLNNSEKKTIIDNKDELNKYIKKIKLLNKKEDEKEEKEGLETNNQVSYKYSADEVRELLQQAYNDLANNGKWKITMGTLTVDFNISKNIDVNDNKIIGTWDYNYGASSYTCNYNYVTQAMSCSGFEDTQNYIKGICNNLYNEYLKYQETGEIEMEQAMEWDEIYGELDACYYEAISRTAPTDFMDDLKSILNKADLSIDDLGVLAN